MNFYVASRFASYIAVRKVVEDFERAGHTVTEDWTSGHQFDDSGILINPSDTDEHLTLEEKRRHAIADLNGAAVADVVILLYNPESIGAYIEVGAALLGGKQIYVVGCKQWTIFWSLPNVMMFDDITALYRYFRIPHA